MTGKEAINEILAELYNRIATDYYTTTTEDGVVQDCIDVVEKYEKEIDEPFKPYGYAQYDPDYPHK